jgi:predicted small secreted protein
MMIRLVNVLALLLSLTLAASGQTSRGAGQDADAKEALAVVDRLFEAIHKKEAAAFEGLFIAEAHYVATDRRNGTPQRRVFDSDSFVKLFLAQKGVMTERMEAPEVRLTGDLAVVWGRYRFYVDGRFSHCGTNAFHLMRTLEGWRIVNGASTIETAGCEAENSPKR